MLELRCTKAKSNEKILSGFGVVNAYADSSYLLGAISQYMMARARLAERKVLLYVRTTCSLSFRC